MKIGPLCVLLLGLTPVVGKPVLFYLGTYTDHSSSQGIYRCTLDTTTGKLGPIALAVPAVDPSFLALTVDGRFLYAAEEAPGTGRVEAFRCGDDGRLVRLNRRSANGSGTCHVSVDSSGRNVLVANYSSGSIACFGLKRNGSIGPRTAYIPFSGSGPDKDRQEGPHAHAVYVSPDDAFVYSCDLGTDHIWIFKFNPSTGTLHPADPPAADLPPGSGPRHLAFDRSGKFVYVANELGQSISVLARNSITGNLAPLQSIRRASAENAGTPRATAEIVLHPRGQWLYVSNRGNNTISVYAIDAPGRLDFVQDAAAGVKSPRSIAIDPTGRWMITAGQDDNRIAVLQIDPLTGRLSPTPQSAPVGSPVCVLFEAK